MSLKRGGEGLQLPCKQMPRPAGLLPCASRLFALRCRNEARAGGARQYAAVYLQLRVEEIEAGMGQHWNCPHNLLAWMTRHAGAGNTAGAVIL
jgi:hypothetical protein